MKKSSLLNKTLKTLSKLPDDKVKEILNFAEYLLDKQERESLNKGVYNLNAESTSFDFLKEEEELYTVEDLKEKY